MDQSKAFTQFITIVATEYSRLETMKMLALGQKYCEHCQRWTSPYHLSSDKCCFCGCDYGDQEPQPRARMS